MKQNISKREQKKIRNEEKRKEKKEPVNNGGSVISMLSLWNEMYYYSNYNRA